MAHISRTMFENEGLSHLRNGLVKAAGVHIQHFSHNEVLLQTVTSKGSIASGSLCLDVESLPEIIKNLARVYLDNHPSSGDVLQRRIAQALEMDGRTPTPAEDLDAIEDMTAAPRF